MSICLAWQASAAISSLAVGRTDRITQLHSVILDFNRHCASGRNFIQCLCRESEVGRGANAPGRFVEH